MPSDRDRLAPAVMPEANNMSLSALQQWLPSVDVRSIGDYARPQISGGFAIPAAGGTVSIDGRYQPLPQGRPELGATIGYKRQF